MTLGMLGIFVVVSIFIPCKELETTTATSEYAEPATSEACESAIPATPTDEHMPTVSEIPSTISTKADTTTATITEPKSLPTTEITTAPRPETPEESFISLGEFRLTAYCSCEKCCGKWAKNRPVDKDGNIIVLTASGATAKAGWTVAADISVLPFGTRIYINGHEYEVQDVGGAIKGNRIDIYFDDHQEALRFGVQYAEVVMKQAVT